MATGSITVNLNLQAGKAGGNYTWQPTSTAWEILYVSGGYNGAGDTATASIASIPQGAYITSVSVSSSNPCAYFMGQILLKSSNAGKIRNYLNSLCGDYSTAKISAVISENTYPLRKTMSGTKPSTAIGTVPSAYTFSKTSNNTLTIYYDTEITRPVAEDETAPTGDGLTFRIEPTGVAVGGEVIQGTTEANTFECYHDAYFAQPVTISSDACLTYKMSWQNLTPTTSWANIDQLKYAIEGNKVYIKGILEGELTGTITTLPTEARPSSTVHTIIPTADDKIRATLSIDTTGVVNIANAYSCGTGSIITTESTLNLNFSFYI